MADKMTGERAIQCAEEWEQKALVSSGIAYMQARAMGRFYRKLAEIKYGVKQSWAEAYKEE